MYTLNKVICVVTYTCYEEGSEIPTFKLDSPSNSELQGPPSFQSLNITASYNMIPLKQS